MAAHPETGRADLLLVHLADVPETKRLAAANRLIKTAGISGTRAMEIKMAALIPRQNPYLYVTAAEYRRVLGRRGRA